MQYYKQQGIKTLSIDLPYDILKTLRRSTRIPHGARSHSSSVAIKKRNYFAVNLGRNYKPQLAMKMNDQRCCYGD